VGVAARYTVAGNGAQGGTRVAASETTGEAGASRPRLVANGLLIAAVLLYAATFLDPTPDFWTLLLRRTSEAGVAGGVADWFAVTALFRRPLGLPIPHTGVIPNNQERIARGMARFVENHFLQPSTIAGRLRSADLSGVAARWLADPVNAAAVADRSAQALAGVIAAIPEEALRGFVRRAALRGISTIDLASLFAMGLQAMYDSGRHQELYDGVVGSLRDWLEKNPGRLEELVEQRTAWWVPRAVDRGLGRAMSLQAHLLIGELAPADSEARDAFDAAVAKLIEDVRTQPRYRRRIEALKRDLLGSEQFAVSLDGAAEELRRLLLEDMSANRSALRDAVAEAAQSFGQRLCENEAMRKRLERRVIWIVRGMVMPWRQSIGKFFADVMRGWDTRLLADRLEAAVGRDLQYVRINGTLVGGLVGGVLFLVTYFIE